MAQMDLKELVNIVSTAKDQYYNLGQSSITDAEYDAYEAELRARDPGNPVLQKIGSDVRGNKVKLPIPMGSLDQVQEGETVKWIRNQSLEKVDIVATDKLDGNSVLLVYSDNGDLHSAYSRGDGTYGQDVTRHVRRMSGVPLSGVQGIRYIVAEVIMSNSAFDRIVGMIERETGQRYKNARNFVAGQMNRENALELFVLNTHIVAFGCQSPLYTMSSKLDQLNQLKSNGFIIPGYQVFKGSKLTDEILTDYLSQQHHNSIYALDGLVLDVDDGKLREKMTGNKKSSSLNPAYARKFKVGQEDNSAITTVKQVHWNISKDGYIKPRVEIDPVDLVGVTVTYATGFNAGFIVKNGIGAGARIKITRSGDVIPFIQTVVEPVDPDWPDVDVVGPYSWRENDQGDKVDLVLDEPENHPHVKLRKIKHFFNSLGVEYISDSGLEKLFDAGYTTVESLLLAEKSQLQDIIGQANGRKGYDSLHGILTDCDPWLLAGAYPDFGRNLGVRKFKKIYEKYGKITGLTFDELLEVPSFSEKTSTVYLENQHRYVEFLDKIKTVVTFRKTKQIGRPVAGKFSNQVVVFTGIRSTKHEKMIVEQGGTVGSGVNSKTTLVVAKDPNSSSSKVKKARDLGITIVSFDQFSGEQDVGNI